MARGGSGHVQTWATLSQGVRDAGEGGEGQSQEEGAVGHVSESSPPPRRPCPGPMGPDSSHLDGPQD